MVKVAVLDDYQGVAQQMADWSSLPADTDVQFFNDHLTEEDALVQRLGDFEVICAMRERTPFQRSLLSRLPKLKLLITTGARNASFDMVAAKELGITVCGTAGKPTPTAELTWGLILALLRHIPDEDKATRSGKWQTTLGVDLHGRTLGLLGLGNLGGQVPNVGRAFGMNVIAWSQNLTQERCDEYGAKLVSKEDLLSTADVVSIHLVLSGRTRGLLGAEDLARMKPTAYLVNTSRGPIVDEAALVAALREKRIAGAGLDTFEQEPLPAGHPFLTLENTVLTPHLGYVTEASYGAYYGDTVEDIAAWLKGSPVRVIE